MINNKPDISIVIPAYNEAKFIRRTLVSLSKQQFDGTFEVIVADNNSKDATNRIAQELGARVVFEKKPGVCAARQAGTRAAKGKIIVSTDADTIYKKDWLQNIANGFKNNPAAAAVTSGVTFVGAPWWGRAYTALVFGGNALLFRLTGKLVYVSACNLAFKRNIWEGYNVELTQGGDELDQLRRFKKHGPVVFIPDNNVLTSSRRLARGLLYSVFVTSFVYYMLDYNISRLTGRSFFGSYQAIREEYSKWHWLYRWRPIFLGLLLGIISVLMYSHRALAPRVYRTTRQHIQQLRQKL